MKDFINYLKEKKFIILVFFLILLVFALIYSLYDVREEAIQYAGLLSILIVILFMVFDFIAYKNKLNDLRRIEEQIDISLLPLSKIQTEKEYQRILNSLSKNYIEYDKRNQEDRKSLEEFFIMWTHQIKLPISALNTYIDSNDEINKVVLKGQIKKIQQYSDMVMAYIRLESEKSDLLFEEHDLDEIIKFVIKEFKLDFINKKLSLNFQPTGLKVITDKKWFTFALEQILSNAVKYTKVGGVSIAHEGMKLVIKDTGIGIKEADLPRIFDKGYTGYNGRINSEASGLGLFLVKRTLDKLNHEISIESKLNEGTKVGIILTKKEELYD